MLKTVCQIFGHSERKRPISAMTSRSGAVPGPVIGHNYECRWCGLFFRFEEWKRPPAPPRPTRGE